MPSPRSTAPSPVVKLIPQLVEFAAQNYGDSPFQLRWSPGGWKTTTFREAASAVHAMTALLEREGVKPGDRVGLQADNRGEWGHAYLAILEAGGIVVPLDAQLKEHEVGEILVASGANMAIGDKKHLGVLQAAAALRVPNLKLVSLDASDTLPSYVEAQEKFPKEKARPERADANDMAVIIFTSGTTGQAKGVMLSHANLLYNVEGVARSFEFGPGDRFLSILPLHHTFESTGGLLCPLRLGASVAYGRGLNSKELREDMVTSGTTLFIGVPLLYEKLISAIHKGIDDAPIVPRIFAKTLLGVTKLIRVTTGLRVGRTMAGPLRRKAGLDSLRMFVTGAAPFAPEIFWQYIDLGWPVLEGYGLTETSPVVCANHPPHPNPGGVGWPLVGVDVRIDQPDSEGNGEIVVRGPNVMLGYYGNPAATAEVLRDGWFYTGDLGCFLPDGRVRITGRLKNMIATAAGKKIYPEEVEVQLGNSPYILEAVVVGGKDAKGEREEVHAHIVPNLTELELHARALGKPLDDAFVEATIKADVETRCAVLAPYKRPKRVIIRASEFAKTTTGKIKRGGLSADATAEKAKAAGVA